MVDSCDADTVALNPRNGLLAGQRVLVTGAGRGIGAAIARICAAEGAAAIAITARTSSELEAVAHSIQEEYQQRILLQKQQRTDDDASNDTPESSPPAPPPVVLVLPADSTNQSQVDDMIDRILASPDFGDGGLDILINNAGVGQAFKGPLETLESDDLERVLTLNVVSVHRVIKAVLDKQAMKKETELKNLPRHIVNISSRAGKQGLPNYSFYVASKFALEGMTASLAAELQPFNIHVNSISPGMVDTKTFPKPAGKPGVRKPESIRDGLLLLLTTTSMTGHYLHVDELDLARERGWHDAAALKPIDEPTFGSSPSSS